MEGVALMREERCLCRDLVETAEAIVLLRTDGSRWEDNIYRGLK
jgi:hypothetical protein